MRQQKTKRRIERTPRPVKLRFARRAFEARRVPARQIQKMIEVLSLEERAKVIGRASY